MESVGKSKHSIAKVRQGGVQEGREPGDEGESVAPIAVGNAIDRVDRSLFVESEVDPTDEPSELDQDPGILEPNDTQDGGKGEVGHRESLDPYSNNSHQLDIVLRDELGECDQEANLKSCLSMVWHGQEGGKTEQKEFDPVKSKRNNVGETDSDHDELEDFDAPPYSF